MPVLTSTALSAATDHGRLPSTTPWDCRVDPWEAVAEGPVFRRLAQHVLALAIRDRDQTVVDLGAGTGLLSLAAAPSARHVIAIDYSAPMLQRLGELADAAELRNVSCIRADLREIPLPDDHADVAVSSYAFHHLDDAGKEIALAEARRILRPGGRIVVCDMMFALSLRPADRRVILDKVRTVARKGPAGLARIARNAARVATGRWEHPSPPERWQALLAARGFVDIDVQMIENEAGVATATRPVGGSAS